MKNSNPHCKSNSSCTDYDGLLVLELYEWPLAGKIVVSVILAVAIVLTILGNSVTIVVLASWGPSKKFINIVIVISLAIADLLVGLTVVPCALDSVVSGLWRCGNFWGTFNGFGNFFFCISSIMHLMALSIDRYVAILYPLSYHRVITKKKSILICIALWAYSGIWALLPLFNVSSYECFIPYIGVQCKQEDWSGESNSALLFAVLVVSGTYGVAAIVICYTYIKILSVIFKQVKKINRRSKLSAASEAYPNKPKIAGDKRLTKSTSGRKGVFTLLSVIIVYICSWSPYCIFTFIEIAEKKKLSNTAAIITMFIGFVNSMCNPIIYVIKYKRFRFEFVKLFRINRSNKVESSSSNPVKSSFKGLINNVSKGKSKHYCFANEPQSLDGFQMQMLDGGKQRNKEADKTGEQCTDYLEKQQVQTSEKKQSDAKYSACLSFTQNFLPPQKEHNYSKEQLSILVTNF